jgi:hypothetical protein
MATIETITYNAKAKELNIIFGYDTNSVYVHVNVPKVRFDEMMSAESKGKYYHANIKGKYDFEKVEIDLIGLR